MRKQDSLSQASRWFEACDAEQWRARFHAATGADLADLVCSDLAASDVRSVSLVGSIPLGIATEQSDVDAIVIVADACSLPARATQGVRYTSAGTSLIVMERMTVISDVEVNSVYVRQGDLDRLCSCLRASGALISGEERTVLGRLAKGWLIRGTFSEPHAKALASRALDLHCAAKSLATAVNELRDARAAAVDNPPLCLYLIRASIEHALLAYFASRGYAALGTKWLRFSSHHASAAPDYQSIFDAYVHLLFPARESPVQQLLEQAVRCLAEIRRLIETQPAFKLALLLCPHLD